MHERLHPSLSSVGDFMFPALKDSKLHQNYPAKSPHTTALNYEEKCDQCLGLLVRVESK